MCYFVFDKINSKKYAFVSVLGVFCQRQKIIGVGNPSVSLRILRASVVKIKKKLVDSPRFPNFKLSKFQSFPLLKNDSGSCIRSSAAVITTIPKIVG